MEKLLLLQHTNQILIIPGYLLTYFDIVIKKFKRTTNEFEIEFIKSIKSTGLNENE